MGEFDFTYILPENFEKRVVQYLLQLANRQLAEAFQHEHSVPAGTGYH